MKFLEVKSFLTRFVKCIRMVLCVSVVFGPSFARAETAEDVSVFKKLSPDHTIKRLAEIYSDKTNEKFENSFSGEALPVKLTFCGKTALIFTFLISLK